MERQIGSDAIYTAITPTLNYRVMLGSTTIYRGRAVAAPSGIISVNVSEIVYDYLESEEFPQRNVNPILYEEENGYIRVYLYRINNDESTRLLGEYSFLRSYDEDWAAGVYDSREEVWTGQSITMSNPINGRLDPRMQQLYTVYRRTTGETITWGIVPKIRVIPSKIVADPDGGTYTVTIISNVPFTASTQDGWVSISGSGDTYTVTVQPNSGDDRNGGIILSYLDENDNPATTIIPVEQASYAVKIVPTSIHFGVDSGESRFTVISNVEAVPVTGASWLTYEVYRTGDGFTTYRLYATSNRNGSTERTATITARGATLYVNQDMFQLTYSIDVTDFDPTGQTGTLTVSANSEYEVTTSAAWISVSPSGGTSGITEFEVIVEPNRTGYDRTGYIIVDGIYIEVTQEKDMRVPYVFFEPSAATVGWNWVFMVDVLDEFNHGWKMTSDSEWLTVPPTHSEGVGNQSNIPFPGLSPNTTCSDRTGTVYLMDKATSASSSLILTQERPVACSADTTGLIFDNSGSTDIISITGPNYSIWTLSENADWLTLSQTYGTGATSVYVTASANTTGSDRSATITFISNGCEDTRTVINVRQTQIAPSVSDYLKFDIVSGGTVIWKKQLNGGDAKTISYSLNSGNTWTDITSDYGNPPTINVYAGDSILFKGINDNYGGANYPSCFGGTAKFSLGGNILSMIYGDNFSGETTMAVSAFTGTFSGSNVIDARGLILPNTTSAQCYQGMFASCTSLIHPPQLPALQLSYGCYADMFSGCLSLTTAPELPSTSITSSCYSEMFSNCASLTAAPALPATALAQRCYRQMFRNCISLTETPQLPATGLAIYCYDYMFSGCTSLTGTTELPATTMVERCYNGMFAGCTSLQTAPDLLASNMYDYCYAYMFDGCSSLNYIKCLATLFASYATTKWVRGVSSSGTFVVAESQEPYWGRDDSGIPTNWTIIKV